MFTFCRSLFLATRIKTLVASIAPVLFGSALSFVDEPFGGNDYMIFFLILSSAIFIQIGTNFTNDVYDYIKGADNENRLGPKRAVQSNLISINAMKVSALICFLISIALGVPLVLKGGVPIVLIGIFSIISGYLYTAGPYPLGYNGWGDIFVFCFFGPIAVCGTYYLLSNYYISHGSIIAGIILGSLSTSLLCVNNIRDTETDRVAGKRTLAVRFSPDFVRNIFIILILLSNILNIYLLNHLSIDLEIILLNLLLFVPSLVLCIGVYLLSSTKLNYLLMGVSLFIILYSIVFLSIILYDYQSH